MKKTACALVCIIMLCLAALTVNCAEKDANEKPETSAEAYALYCADNGETVLSENADKKMKPASTTKIMTSLITLEQAAASDKQLAFTQDMAAEGSSMYLKQGDRLRLSDLAAGMMMASGNDAANAAAITISGSNESFAELMNTRAKQIGMKNTHFVTPSGLDDDNHYSTAGDMALLMAYALENEDFARLTAQKSVTVSFLNDNSKKLTYTNHNRLLSMYEYCTGGKTGYTAAAGRCLVTSAEKDGLTLVCVTLNDRNDWEDHRALYEYGFSRLSFYETDDSGFCADIPCVGGESDSVCVVGENSGGFVVASEDRDRVERRVCINSFLYAPVIRNEIVGKVEYTLGKKTLYTSNIIASDEVKGLGLSKNIFTVIAEFFT